MRKLFSLPFVAFTGLLAVTLLSSATMHAQDAARPNATPTFTESVLLSFTGTSGSPFANTLVQASNGNFYGTTSSGGLDNVGTVFTLTPSGGYTLLHSFASGPMDGEGPIAGVIQGTDGNFYGTTANGGTSNMGTVFQSTPGGVITLLHSFAGGATDGEGSNSGLVQGTDGNFYGVTGLGGAADAGTFFKVTPGGSFTLLHSFAGAPGDGDGPMGLLQGADGNFYGTTSTGGSNNMGTIFKVTPGGVLSLLHSFAGGATDGDEPLVGLVQGTDGNFYGDTADGGAQDFGVVYKITPTGVFTLIHSFLGGTTDGEAPLSGLIQGSDGNFYGATEGGGTGGDGTFFRLTPAGALTLLYSFAGEPGDGSEPYGGIVQGADGNFYGNTDSGGEQNVGTIFKITASPALAAPVQLSVPASVTAGSTFNLSYLVTNAASDTMQQCFATNTAGDTTWTGVKTAATTATSVTLTANSTAGIYNYTLTCGGMESSTASLDVGAVKAATSLALALNSPLLVQSAYAMATATVSAQNIGPLTGTVEFFYGNTAIGTLTLSNGSASLNVDAMSIPVGTYPITAMYSGNSLYLASSATADLVIQADPTSISLSVGPSPVVQGQLLSFETSIERLAGNAPYPTGTVAFYYGTTEFASEAVSDGTANMTLNTNTSIAPGIYAITAKYSGDAFNAPSASMAVDLAVQTRTATGLTVTPNPVPPNHALTLTAKVTEDHGQEAPTGTVTFMVGTTVAGMATLDSGTAVVDLTDAGIAAGTYPLRAVYSGDGIDVASTSATVNVVVQ